MRPARADREDGGREGLEEPVHAVRKALRELVGAERGRHQPARGGGGEETVAGQLGQRPKSVGERDPGELGELQSELHVLDVGAGDGHHERGDVALQAISVEVA